MAIDSNNEKLSIMAFNNVFMPPVYMTIDGITQTDQQQLLWQYPGVLFAEAVVYEEELSNATQIKTAIRDRLINDATYLSLMDSPTDSVKHTYYLRAPIKPTFPEVIFSTRPNVTNQSYSHKELIISRGTLLIEVWAKNNDYEDIADRIIYLLHHYFASPGFRTIYSGESEELYDANMNTYGISLTFDLHRKRAII